MEDYVKDAILTNEFTDLCLIRLVDLTITSIRNNRPLFPTLLDEPVFFRKYFYLWVSEALEEKKMLAEAEARDFLNGE